MADLKNSLRVLHKATYVPTRTNPQSPSQPPTTRVMEKVAFLRRLALQPDEIAALEQGDNDPGAQVKVADVPGNPFGARAAVKLAEIVRPLVTDPLSGTTERYAPLLMRVSPEQIAVLTRRLIDLRSAKRADTAMATAGSADEIAALLNGFLDRFKIEPVGRLHLERMEMTPVGIEHGELLYSIPLVPQETVNLTHREWSVTTSTFENIVQDYFEGFSEEGVADKTDLNHAASNESRHSSALDVNGNVSTSYQTGGFSVTASAGVNYKSSAEDSAAVKDSVAHSLAITRTASARTRKEHKVSFRVTSVAGTADRAVRVLTNPTQQAMRIDYFRLMRKWRVRLIRYGLRMTYDIVVPNPGNDLAKKVLELYALKQEMAREHKFDLKLSQVTISTWSAYAEKYGVSVDPPPQDPIEMMATVTLQRSIDVLTTGTMDFDIPAGYRVIEGAFSTRVHLDDGHYGGGYRAQIGLKGEHFEEFPNKDGAFDVPLSVGSIVGHTGRVFLLFDYYNVESGWCLARVKASPTQEAIDAWRFKVWSQLRDADEMAFATARARMDDRKAELEKELGAFDALTLRRMEREEIMKSVLEWLLGPTFKIRPGALDPLLDDPDAVVFGTPSVDNWKAIMIYGEFIKYIHNAVEWENVIFFPYPYFWDATTRWPFKQFLVHPDLEHRSFLRSGCARVVLTVRPGFEESFAALMETGSIQVVLGRDHPYVSIGQEIRNFAMTNYEGIPPANPDANVRFLLYPEQRKAWRDMQRIMLLLEDYSAKAHIKDPKLPPEVKVYPTTAQGLAALQAPPDVSLVDPWGKPYVYTSPGLFGDYDLACYGRSGKPGGDDLDADITSWAAGSVISEWNEYTPTGAMDVKVNTALVTAPDPA
jgi:hypothetical protein